LLLLLLLLLLLKGLRCIAFVPALLPHPQHELFWLLTHAFFFFLLFVFAFRERTHAHNTTTTDEKLYNLCSNPITRELRAVQNRRFITIPFSATTLGVRIGSLAYNLAEAVTALVNNSPLSAVQFTEVSFDGDHGGATEALGKSGAIVYTRLPIFTNDTHNADLETICPGGGLSNIFIANDMIADDTDKIKPVEKEDEDDQADEKKDDHADEKKDSHDDHDHAEDCHCDGDEVHCDDPSEEDDCQCHDGEVHCEGNEEASGSVLSGLVCPAALASAVFVAAAL